MSVFSKQLLSTMIYYGYRTEKCLVSQGLLRVGSNVSKIQEITKKYGAYS